jgi:hypothetical protein
VARRIPLLFLCALAGLAAGCASVKPWQREELSRRSMVGDQAAGEQRFDDHSRAAREGAIGGGGGEAGGGCGCN